MTVQDYKRAAAELRAFNLENRWRRYYLDYLSRMPAPAPDEFPAITRIAIRWYKKMAHLHASAQMWADHSFNNI